MYVTRDKSREEENSEAFARQKEIEPSDSIYEGSCLIIWEYVEWEWEYHIRFQSDIQRKFVNLLCLIPQ